MVRLTVQLFAIARQRLGAGSIAVELPEPATVADLKRVLSEQHPELAPLLSSARIAVNSEYADDKMVIPPNAELALIPPVSGGSPNPPLNEP